MPSPINTLSDMIATTLRNMDPTGILKNNALFERLYLQQMPLNEMITYVVENKLNDHR